MFAEDPITIPLYSPDLLYASRRASRASSRTRPASTTACASPRSRAEERGPAGACAPTSCSGLAAHGAHPPRGEPAGLRRWCGSIPGTVVEQLLGQAAMASPEVLASLPPLLRPRPAPARAVPGAGSAGLLRGDLGRLVALRAARCSALFLERLPGLGRAGRARGGLVAAARHPARHRLRGLARRAARRPDPRAARRSASPCPAFWQGTVLILLFSRLPRLDARRSSGCRSPASPRRTSPSWRCPR